LKTSPKSNYNSIEIPQHLEQINIPPFIDKKEEQVPLDNQEMKEGVYRRNEQKFEKMEEKLGSLEGMVSLALVQHLMENMKDMKEEQLNLKKLVHNCSQKLTHAEDRISKLELLGPKTSSMNSEIDTLHQKTKVLEGFIDIEGSRELEVNDRYFKLLSRFFSKFTTSCFENESPGNRRKSVDMFKEELSNFTEELEYFKRKYQGKKMNFGFQLYIQNIEDKISKMNHQ